MPKTRTTERRLLTILSLLTTAGLTTICPSAASAAQFDVSEEAFDATYEATPITLSGAVVDEAGAPIVGASITLLAWDEPLTVKTVSGTTSTSQITTASGATNISGAFSLANLKRRSVLARVEHPNYYPEIIPVDLQRPMAEGTTSLGSVVMSARGAGRARLIFSGDTMFGRRFTDADQDGDEGEAGDLIAPATRGDNARAVIEYMRDLMSSADYTTVNLESPTTASPTTPHPYKDYTFYSHPDTLAALPYAGIDAVDLANNHMFDYLSGGVTDTLLHVSNRGLDWCGAGTNEDDAEKTTIYRTVNGVPLSLLGFSMMTSDGSSDTDYLLVAQDDPDKAGALSGTTKNLKAFMSVEAPQRLAIPMFHGGTEYTDYPTDVMRSRFISAAQQGAGLVVAHHPHTIHGIGVTNSRYVLMSLGNFVFDQDIFETFQSYIAIVDVQMTPNGGYDVRRLSVVPFQLENYVPKMVTGNWLARAGRHIGHLSTTLPTKPTSSTTADGLAGAVVFPSGGRVVALRDSSQYTTLSSTQALTLTAANPPLDKKNTTDKMTDAIEYVRLNPADSLAQVKTNVAAKVEYGREILHYGDFEDLDVDDSFSEGSAWDQSTVRYVQNSVVRSGTGAAVLLRSKTSTTQAIMSTVNRIGIAGDENLTLTGWIKGDNAGEFRLGVRIYSAAATILQDTEPYIKAASTYGWTKFSVNITPSTSAASLRIYLKGAPPASGESRVYIDDISLIAWEGSVSNALNGFSLPTPNNWSWLRFTTLPTTSLGVTLTHRSYTQNPVTP